MKTQRILVADDDLPLLELMSRRLARAGYAVDQAADGRQALGKISQARYDVIVTDINMPGMTGLEILAAVKEIDTTIEVVIVTGGATMETAIEALNAGAFGYLIKPFDHLGVLDKIVAKAIDYRRLVLDNRRLAEIQKRRGDLLEAEVTARIQQLRRRHEEILQILAGMPDGVMVLDAQQKVILSNPVADQWCEQAPDGHQQPVEAICGWLSERSLGGDQVLMLRGRRMRLRALPLFHDDGLGRQLLIVQEPGRATMESDPEIAACLGRLRYGAASLEHHIGEGQAAKILADLNEDLNEVIELIQGEIIPAARAAGAAASQPTGSDAQPRSWAGRELVDGQSDSAHEGAWHDRSQAAEDQPAPWPPPTADPRGEAA
jgi:DNA-binding response OmpR family regulator